MVASVETAQLSSQTRAIKSRVDEATGFLKKLANRDRLLVVCALVEAERSVRELEDLLDIRQPGLSQQLAELRSAGIVESRKQGKAVYYHLADPRAKALITTMYEQFCGEKPGSAP